MDNTTIEIPGEILQSAKLTPDQLKKELAVYLFQQGRISAEQAKLLAGDDDGQLERMIWRKDNKFDLDTFLDWASHDLKTPLNAVIGFTRVVLKGIDGPINETQNIDLTSAYTGGQRMLSLVSMLVDIARLNIGQIPLNQEEGNIAELLTESTARWRTQNPKKELTVDVTINAPVIHFDNLRMRQILAYMLNYAALTVAEGGQVSLSVADDENGVNFTIQSSGERPREKQDMDKSMIAYITQTLIELHGGSISMMESTDNSAIIMFTMPR